MALNPTRMAADMYARGQAIRFRGPRFFDYCTVVSQGSVQAIVGKSFTTIDTGLIQTVATPGIGAGTGTGLTAVLVNTVRDTVVSTARGFQFRGPRLIDTAQIFAEALVEELTQTTLVSTHTPVYLGAGVVVPGSIPVVMSEWKGNIQTLGTAIRFRGPKWPQWCESLATGGVTGFLTATGNVTIVGTYTGLFPPAGPGPVPGVGVGVGVVS